MENKELKNRNPNRLKEFDYSTPKGYFITVCIKGREKILSNIIVGDGVLDVPKIELSEFGKIADKYIKQMNEFYNDLSVDYYVIMPNHIHFLICIYENGQSGTPVPTRQNSKIANFISTFKRFCNKEYGFNPWQRSFYDHVIRNRQDYNEVAKYIYNNPLNWKNDELY